MKSYVYISCWDEHGGAPGMGLHEMDGNTGEIHFIKQLNDELSLNAACLDREKMVLYVDNETAVAPGKFTGGGGRVMAYQVNPEDGSLTELSAVPTYVPNPAWPQLDESGKYLLVANHSAFGTATKLIEKEDGSYGCELVYDDAAVELIERNSDGSLGAVIHAVKHDMRVPGRALHSHPHCCVPYPGKNLYLVTDKGECRIYLYSIDYAARKLIRHETYFQLPMGSAPRYAVFHPNKPYVYVNQERNMDICCFTYDEQGELSLVGTVSTLPEGHRRPEGVLYEQQGFLSSEDGKYVYSVLNGPNQIAVLRVDEKTGKLLLIQNMPVDGIWPRGAAFSPDGNFLIVSCLVSGDVLTYRVREDGTLEETGFRSHQRGGSYITVL